MEGAINCFQQIHWVNLMIRHILLVSGEDTVQVKNCDISGKQLGGSTEYHMKVVWYTSTSPEIGNLRLQAIISTISWFSAQFLMPRFCRYAL